MRRRTFLGAAAAALARPGLAQPAKVLRFVPESDVAVLDPVWTTATVTRSHGYLVFDTLYGQDARLDLHPQMVAGHTVEADATVWRLRSLVAGGVVPGDAFDEEVDGRVDESAGEPVRTAGTVLHVGGGTTRPAARAMPGSASPSAGATS